jgi:hypothetical protein
MRCQSWSPPPPAKAGAWAARCRAHGCWASGSTRALIRDFDRLTQHEAGIAVDCEVRDGSRATRCQCGIAGVETGRQRSRIRRRQGPLLISRHQRLHGAIAAPAVFLPVSHCAFVVPAAHTPAISDVSEQVRFAAACAARLAEIFMSNVLSVTLPLYFRRQSPLPTSGPHPQ